jgi:uncharacterized surface protein with fasciclin (FAS1) repeats
MNRFSKVLIVVVLALLLVVPLAGAQEQTIVDVAVNDGRFDTLVAAVVAADLADALSGGEWTVFAPTDDAFAELGLDASNIALAFTQEELTNILLYHVVPENLSTAEAKANQGDITMANGELAGIKFFDDSIWVNDDSQVIIPNIVTSNGTIHVVDKVILPPWPRSEGMEAEIPAEEVAADVTVVEPEAPVAEAEAAMPAAEDMEAMPAEEAPISGNSIVAIASQDGRFSTLVAAVAAAGLADPLSDGEWTVFAPTDEAFAKLGLDATNIASSFSQAELTDILLYHAVSESLSSAEAKANQGDITMANGELAGLKYFDGSLYVNDDAKVIIENIVADNGTIHVVDNVILGPWPRE